MSANDISETLSMMQARLGYRLVVDKFASAAACADALGVTRSSVSAWRLRGVPVKYLDKLRKLTGLELHEVRPDLFTVRGDSQLQDSQDSQESQPEQQ
jgi:hypothetical protein